MPCRFVQSNLQHPQSSHTKVIQSHPFVHRIDILTSNTTIAPLLDDQTFFHYYIIQGPCDEFFKFILDNASLYNITSCSIAGVENQNFIHNQQIEFDFHKDAKHYFSTTKYSIPSIHRESFLNSCSKVLPICNVLVSTTQINFSNYPQLKYQPISYTMIHKELTGRIPNPTDFVETNPLDLLHAVDELSLQQQQCKEKIQQYRLQGFFSTSQILFICQSLLQQSNNSAIIIQVHSMNKKNYTFFVQPDGTYYLFAITK